MKAQTHQRRRSMPAILGSLLLWAAPTMSQEASPPAVHWAYASFFGTGWYEISNQQSAFIASFTPQWTTGTMTWPASRGGTAAYRVRVPLSIGVTRFDLDDVPAILDLGNFSTVSVGLAADLDLPVSERLSIRPGVQLSYGTVLGESNYAWTYRGDIRGRYRFGSGDRALIAAAGAVAYDANSGPDDSFTYATFAAEFAFPLQRFSTDEQVALLHWHVAYTDFLNRMEVAGDSGQVNEITNYWQAGIAFGWRNEDVRLWFLRFERLGLAYDVSPSGDLRGIKFVFRSLYDS